MIGGEEMDIDRKPATRMSVMAIVKELDALGTKWDAFRKEIAEDGGWGGSPGEWMVERMGELEHELKRRRAKKGRR